MRYGFFVRAALGASLLFGAATTSSVAFAADPSPEDIAQARDLGQQAKAAFDAGRFAESEKLWSAASSLYPAAPTLTLGLARTQAKLGKVVLAQESYNKILREQGQSASLSPAFKDALEAARAEIGPVSARIASVVIHVEGPSDPIVTIDGQSVAAAGLGLKRPIDPGAHVVRAEAPGYAPAETTFEVAESGAAEAKLTLTKVDVAKPAISAPASVDTGPRPTEADASGKGKNRTLAIAALGVGGAGLVFGSVTGVLALGQHGDLSDRCPGGRCPNDVSGDVDSYKTMGMLSTIGFVVGGVGLATGAVLWLAAPRETQGASAGRAAPRGVSWQPYVGAGGGGVMGRF